MKTISPSLDLASRSRPDTLLELVNMFPRFVIAVHHPALREEIRRFLSARGFEVLVAANGMQCIEHLQEAVPTVLVLDPHIQWGGGDGVLDWLHDEAPFCEVTVVLADNGNTAAVPHRLRSMVHECYPCPSNLPDLQQFIACLEQLAWRRSEESPLNNTPVGIPQ